MSPEFLRRLREIKRILWNEQGQISIFIALIFQILFVFFAMIINIGLMVHDKINLQNAADLAAYYAAERQAEIMNEMAHINFQIRQDNKLLTWRYRVIGTLGRSGTNGGTNAYPPARVADASSLTEKAWVNPSYASDEMPSICVANESWSDMLKKGTSLENYCFRKYGQKVPTIPNIPQIAPFVPGVAESQAFAKQAQQFQLQSCAQAGPLNWAFTMEIIYDYKLTIAARKEMFWSLRQNLLQADPVDLSNQSIKTGAQTTLIKNLTESNRNQGNVDFQMLNGLSLPGCNIGDGGEFEFAEVRTAPQLLYDNYQCDAGSALYFTVQSDTSNLAADQLNKWDPTNVLRSLAKGEPEATSPYHSTLGFEKNPWCMAYMGVKVSTQSRKPFSPFGTATTLTARAFAQPFGGRIGPWYKSRWSNGASASAGGDRVDPLTVPRLIGNAFDSSTQAQRLPNYSRFPGDQLGMTSEISMGLENAKIVSYTANTDYTKRLQLNFYSGFDSVPTTGDELVSSSGTSGALRSAEIAAIAPDLFDAVYYSVDPNYYQAYSLGSTNRAQGLNPIFGQTVKQLGDLGSDTTNPGFNVSNQITQALTVGMDPKVLPKAYYVIRDWTHLLTGWLANGLQDYTFPTSRFATCTEQAVDKYPIPGMCWQGARTGYSVRLISRSALTYQKWAIGGDGESPGAILNPPTSDF